ncbi:MAG: aminotransferase class IV, partial [Sphingopyxis sp.]
DRHFYDDARAASGAFEALFTTADGMVTEGSFTNLFIEQGGQYLTPDDGDAGLLRGVLRAEMLANGTARAARLNVADVRAADARGALYIGNALRGLIHATLG